MEQLTSSQIQEKINNGEDFILKMYATWCGPCKQLTEEEVAKLCEMVSFLLI